MGDLNQFQCPCCGAKLTFDGEKQMMSCMYCDSTFSMEQIMAEEKAKEEMAGGSNMEWSSSASSVITGQDGKIEGYSCPACGAQMVADENTAATECPYCGNFSIIKTSFEGMYRPEVVLPFIVTKEKAKEALNNFTKGKTLLPDAFVNRNRIDSITGLYVPFWLYSCHADGTIYYEGVKSKTWEDNDYKYTKKDYYRMIRSGGMDFDRIPVDASTKMDDAIMDSLEPFDLSKAVGYDAAYFSGYLADRYDVQEVDARPRANERVENSFRDRLREEVKEYEEIKSTAEKINLSNAKAEYAMLPVWMMTTEYENQKYVFGINGQTGQMTGSLPIDKKKEAIQFMLTGAIAAAVAFLIIRLAMGAFTLGYSIAAVVIALIVAFIRDSSLRAAMNTVHKKTTARAYMVQNSVKLGRREDNFLYSKTEKHEKPKQQQQAAR
ncbi:MAG: hypothetical protein E7295_15405 [Lachnospiraceae bacterium]|nr:hypothetical protein [Lachnospiraceae bacterium]